MVIVNIIWGYIGPLVNKSTTLSTCLALGILFATPWWQIWVSTSVISQLNLNSFYTIVCVWPTVELHNSSNYCTMLILSWLMRGKLVCKYTETYLEHRCLGLWGWLERQVWCCRTDQAGLLQRCHDRKWWDYSQVCRESVIILLVSSGPICQFLFLVLSYHSPVKNLLSSVSKFQCILYIPLHHIQCLRWYALIVVHGGLSFVQVERKGSEFILLQGDLQFVGPKHFVEDSFFSRMCILDPVLKFKWL